MAKRVLEDVEGKSFVEERDFKARLSGVTWIVTGTPAKGAAVEVRITGIMFEIQTIRPEFKSKSQNTHDRPKLVD